MIANRLLPGRVSLWVPVCLGMAVAPAYAEFPQPDQEFLDRNIPEVELLASNGAESPTGTADALESVRQILAHRQAALRELHSRVPITTFDGAATQDIYDESVVQALEGILERAPSPAVAPSPEEIDRFETLMKTLPEVGQRPVGFMLLGFAELTVAVSDSLEETGAAPESAAALALERLREVWAAYREIRQDVLSQRAEGFQESTVIGRLRCPVDGSQYRISSMKNKMQPDDSVITMYFLNCLACGAPEVLWFPAQVASRLNKVSKRQKLKEKPRLATPSPGPNP